jgi:hypothetical protein
MRLAALACVVSIAAASPAFADPEAFSPEPLNLNVLDRAVAPVHHGVELSFGGGYTQGVGGAGDIGSLDDMTGAGGTLEGQAGWRVTPHWAAGLYGTLAKFEHGAGLADGNRAYGATAGAQATYHSRPARSVDPWLSLGTGVRGLWLTQHSQTRDRAYGLELARVQLGVDYRITPGVAIAPVIGASASVFLANDATMAGELTSVRDNRLNLYVFGGLLGRFDVARY